MKSSWLKWVLGISLLASLSSNAFADEQDKFEHINRASFCINQHLDKYILRPVAKVYLHVLPPPVVTGITNIFSNINTVSDIPNDLLQLNCYQAYSDAWRVVINSTVGIGGLFDVASHIGLPKHDTDFGLTLATWGYTQSHFLVIPLLGPTTIRDTIAIPVDYYAFSIYPYIRPNYVHYIMWGVNYVNTRANLLQFQGVIDTASFDPYVFQRDAYLQHRNSQIQEAIAGTDWHPLAQEFVAQQQPSLTKLYPYLPGAPNKAIFAHSNSELPPGGPGPEEEGNGFLTLYHYS